MRKLESTHEKALVTAIKGVGGLCIKLPASLYAGIPDRLVILPGGRIYFVEMKRENETPRKLQINYMKKLRSLGCNTLILEGGTQTLEWIETHVKK